MIRTYGYKPNSTWTTDPLFMKVGSEYYFYNNGHLGTPQKMTTVSGAVVWSAKYSSFGKAEVDPASTITNNLNQPGQYFDTETKLHYNYFRYFNEGIGRYLNADPIGIIGGNNLYLYAKNSPVILFDSKGLYEENEHMTNCLGYATRRGGSLRPDSNESLNEVLNKVGYKCTSGITAEKCKEHCKCNDYIMVYVYIPRKLNFDTTKEVYKGRDFFNENWGKFRGTLDYHALRGEPDGSYTYQPSMDYMMGQDIRKYNPKTQHEDYFPESQTLAKECCCKTTN